MTTPATHAPQDAEVEKRAVRAVPDEDDRREAMIDEVLDESFPASDPPAWTHVHAGSPKHAPR